MISARTPRWLTLGFVLATGACYEGAAEPGPEPRLSDRIELTALAVPVAIPSDFEVEYQPVEAAPDFDDEDFDLAASFDPAAAPAEDFIPAMGRYDVIGLYFENDTCGIDVTDAEFEELNEYVIEVLPELSQYMNLVTHDGFPGDQGVDGHICSLQGRMYSCTEDDIVIDLAPLAGFDAVLTSERSDRGVWTLEDRYVRVARQDWRCEGADCELPEVSTLFGTFPNGIPCGTVSVAARGLIEPWEFDPDPFDD